MHDQTTRLLWDKPCTVCHFNLLLKAKEIFKPHAYIMNKAQCFRIIFISFTLHTELGKVQKNNLCSKYNLKGINSPAHRIPNILLCKRTFAIKCTILSTAQEPHQCNYYLKLYTFALQCFMNFHTHWTHVPQHITGVIFEASCSSLGSSITTTKTTIFTDSYQTDKHYLPLAHMTHAYTDNTNNINQIRDVLFLLLHHACCRVTQLLHQPLHIYKIYKIYALKH